jgi:hypothetical protein
LCESENISAVNILQQPFVEVALDLISQMHYTSNGHADVDRSEIGLRFLRRPPE